MRVSRFGRHARVLVFSFGIIVATTFGLAGCDDPPKKELTQAEKAEKARREAGSLCYSRWLDTYARYGSALRHGDDTVVPSNDGYSWMIWGAVDGDTYVIDAHATCFVKDGKIQHFETAGGLHDVGPSGPGRKS